MWLAAQAILAQVSDQEGEAALLVSIDFGSHC